MVKTGKIIGAFVLTAALMLGGVTTAFADTAKDTTATVTFTKDDSVNKLELVSAPAFSFGSHTLPGSGTSIESTSIDDELRIMDTTGNNDGWHVTAKMSQFATDTVSNSMPGAYITLNSGEAERVGTGTTDAPVVPDSVKLVSGATDATGIVSAAENAGIGTWSIIWSLNDVILSVLETPAVGSNTATIDWTLTASPSE